jgi:hypothetical protein
MGDGSNFNMAQIFNPKNYGKFWILFLGKKSAFMMAFNSIFACKKKTKKPQLCCTLFYSKPAIMFLGAKFCH